jgi:hypothetical protein
MDSFFSPISSPIESFPVSACEPRTETPAAVPDTLVRLDELLISCITLLALSSENVAIGASTVNVKTEENGNHRVEIALPSTEADELRLGAQIAQRVFEGLSTARFRNSVRVSFS